MSTPTFIVGTGRCGSTMLSNMLRDHPKVLSLSEFFILITDCLRMTEPFCPDPIDGRKFWEIVAAITPFVSFQLRHGVQTPEWLYPCSDHTARWSSQTGVPAILVTPLPHLTDDHDALFDELKSVAIRWPEAKISEHYRNLFGWLTEHFHKRLWVERSAGSLSMIEQLLAIFPDAKFIHITRDGRDAALSMQEHMGFRLALFLGSIKQLLGVDPIQSLDQSQIDRVPMELRSFLPDSFDAEAFRAHRVSLPLCGDFWTQHISSGLGALSALPHSRLLNLRYEDLLSNTKRELDALASFLGQEFVDAEWSERCAATVRKPRSTWRDLPPEEARALTAACRPGFELLREAGVEYEF
jgi:putative sulfotransferase